MGLLATLVALSAVIAFIVAYLVRNRKAAQQHLPSPAPTAKTGPQRLSSLPPAAPKRAPQRVYYPGSSYAETPADEAFEEHVDQQCAYVIQKIFYAHVAGVSFPNADGSKRLPIVRKCHEREFLLMIPDDSIPGHPMAVALHRADGGGQIGFLDARLAGEVRRDGLHKWACVFRRKLYKPETKIVGGAIICMVRFQDNN